MLGIPAMDNGCAVSQFKEIKKLLEEFKVAKKIDLVTFDTCATNTGTSGGTIKLLSEWLNKPLLQVACRHHIKEILASVFYKNIRAKKNTAPENPFFKKVQKDWYQIKPSLKSEEYQRHDKVSIEGSILESEAKDSIIFCQQFLNQNSERSDYREFAELALMFLSPDHTFPIRNPQNCSNARFMSTAIYSIKLALISNFLPFNLRPREKQELIRMAEFCSIIYVRMFLKSDRVSVCVLQDIKEHHIMLKYREEILSRDEISNSQSTSLISAINDVLKAQDRHSWYLDESLAPLCLLDKELNDENKSAFAKALHCMPKPDSLSHLKRSGK